LLVVALVAVLAGAGASGVVTAPAGPAALAAPGGTAVPPRAAPVPGGTSAQPDREASVRTILDRRGRALLRRDRAAWLRDVDPRATALRRRQAALFDNLAAVPLASWRYVLDPGVVRPLGPAAVTRYTIPFYTPVVTLRYALRGIDGEPTARPQTLTFVQRRSRWLLAADDDLAADGTRTWRGMWDFGPVVTRSGRSSLVLAHPANAGRMATFADAVDDAVPRVTTVWGKAWPRRVALLIPDTVAEMGRLVGEQFAAARIAAVAIADYADPRRRVARGQRVVVNPANLDRLGPLGRRVVLRHEITHVASRAVTADTMPTWLVEGFADYVGYRDSGLPAGLVAQELRAEVRRGVWSGTLPADAEFRGDAPRLPLAYEEAWIACRLIVRRVGVAGLVRLYREVGATPGDGSAAVGRALRRVVGVSTKDFVAEWRALVRAELG
jgi:hypothetical protein